MGRIFFCALQQFGVPLPLGGEGCAIQEGHCLFFSMPLMSTGGRAFQRPRPLVWPILALWHFFLQLS